MGRCRSCPAEIRFARNFKTGQSMPFDPVGVPSDTPGAFALIGRFAYNREDALAYLSESRGVSYVRAAAILDDADAWHISHFATCSDPARHRRRESSSAPGGDSSTLF